MRLSCCFITLFLTTSVLFGQQPGSEVLAKKKARATLAQQIQAKQKELGSTQEAVLKGLDLTGLEKAVRAAMKAIEDKLAADPEIKAARKNKHQIDEALAAAIVAAAAASPEGGALQKEITAAKAKREELNKKLHELVARVVKEKDTVIAAQKALQKVSETRRLLAEKKKPASDPEVQAARKAEGEAAKALETAIAAALAANPESASLQKTIAVLREQGQEARHKLAQLQGKLGKEDPKLVAAQKDSGKAGEILQALMAKKAVAEREILKKASTALNETRQKKITTDPRILAIQQAIEQLHKQDAELVRQVRELEHPAKVAQTAQKQERKTRGKIVEKSAEKAPVAPPTIKSAQPAPAVAHPPIKTAKPALDTPVTKARAALVEAKKKLTEAEGEAGKAREKMHALQSAFDHTMGQVNHRKLAMAQAEKALADAMARIETEVKENTIRQKEQAEAKRIVDLEKQVHDLQAQLRTLTQHLEAHRSQERATTSSEVPRSSSRSPSKHSSRTPEKK